MGASADEIDREIASTRDHLDANLEVLESRARRGVRRAAVMAAVGLAAGLTIAGVTFLVYKKVRRNSLSDRVHDVLPDALTGLPAEIRSRLRHRPFKVVITEGTDEKSPGAWETIGRKVAPAVVSAAVSAVMAQVVRRAAFTRRAVDE